MSGLIAVFTAWFPQPSTAVTQFDLQVCEAYANSEEIIECFAELIIGTDCEGKAASEALACYRNNIKAQITAQEATNSTVADAATASESKANSVIVETNTVTETSSASKLDNQGDRTAIRFAGGLIAFFGLWVVAAFLGFRNQLGPILSVGGSFLISVLGLSVILFSVSPEKQKPFGEIHALELCQFAIRQMARDPETAKIPPVRNFGRGGEFYFAWGASTKFVRMKNGLGLEVPASASCIVDGANHQITSLTINGKSVPTK
ncbi:hypothetical protein [Thiocystis violacea]|uniref:hypothetical protein n=1 Tax=Thiocystis violacea TaxID=13725 RepID=UPI0019050368|nr:hypothetical protein [Thiocystis violacea]